MRRPTGQPTAVIQDWSCSGVVVGSATSSDSSSSVRVVGGAGDLGADVIATTPTGHRIVIQAKRYAPSNRVGSPDLQKVGGTARQVHGAQLVAAVTTSGFTKAARDYAAHPGVEIRLFDHDALARWAARTGPTPWH